jgi:DNA-binding XRE family transcriptional regulator
MEDKARSGQGFGRLLRRFRLAAGLSQEALAERARMSIEGISALERGFAAPPSARRSSSCQAHWRSMTSSGTISK